VIVCAHGQHTEWVVEGLKTEAAAFEAKKRIELGTNRRQDPRTAPTFLSFCVDHYRPYAETHLGADTWRKVRIYQVATLEAHFGTLRLSEIGPFDLDAYKAARLEDVSATAVNNELRILRAMLNWARTERKLPVSDVKISMLPTKGERRVHWWTHDDVAKLYAAARANEPALLPMLVFLLNTGCRKGEALAARWSWIDWERELVCVAPSAEWRPKSGRPREIPMSGALKASLSTPSAKQHETWIFPSTLGDRYSVFPKEAFWRVRDAAKLRGGPHTTRHTFASHFLQAVPDLFLLAQVLGHPHARTTELYAHLLPDHLARAKNAVNLAPKMMATKLAKKSRAS
jgi:integrase